MIEGLFQPLHLVLILAIILIVFGAGKLPELGGSVGRGIREFRKEVHDATSDDPEPEKPVSAPVATVVAKPQTTAFCTNCGERIPKDAKFCSNCGAAVVATDSGATASTSEVEPEPVEDKTPIV
jgi:sec-independent protein translocase protein TatA